MPQKTATLHTNHGDIVINLLPDHAPKTVDNFLGLASGTKEYTDPESGRRTTGRFYDGLTFHRVIDGFMIQGGDPEGTGRGGPGYKFADEPVKGEYTDGAVAMANAGPDTNGSQFFICIDDCRRKLAPSYNLFGYVIDGLDIAKSVQVGDVMKSVTITERASD